MTFESKMSDLGYVLTDMNENKTQLTYEKRKRLSTSVLVFRLDTRDVHPILVASALIMNENDCKLLVGDFLALRKDAELIIKLSGGKFKII